ncbi:hypothetical protein IG193_00410 [Infirmifilum lucidum]|uniref:Uncharacterized protein n=1 Tax=Infirmifilum lucidum TaxID=2776706 RepID=A0A7L9FJ70_9CREN|nr:hypothetical protein [Infirmifilum lucidum]QOJ78964.1 hypothetical protein IG193_00410 [Infirmifilum lucidum]
MLKLKARKWRVFLERLPEDERSALLAKLGVSSIEQAVQVLLEIPGGRVFIHFRGALKRIPGVEYVREFPDMNMASAYVSESSLRELLLDRDVVRVEPVPRVRALGKDASLKE